MSLLDFHAKALKKIVRQHGRPVKFIDPNDVEYPGLIALWNDVEHVLKVESLNGDPMGNRSSLYIDRDSLQTESGEISPTEQWKAFGSPNSYDPEKEYLIEIPKLDRQLPGILLFLSEINPTAERWEKP